MSASPRIYLDHAATTPVIPAACEAMAEAMVRWANASSPHVEGRAARAALEDARGRIAAALGWDGEVILTSGASEAIALGVSSDSIISPIEHDAVEARAGAFRLRSHADGQIDLAGIAEIDYPGRFAIQSVNNETGLIQPLNEILPEISKLGGSLFADCSQSAGKMALPDADMIAISAHKLGGPPGIGALLIRDLSLLTPTGGQEQGYRRGTENVPAAIGFAIALEAGFEWMDDTTRLRAMLDAAITGGGGEIVAQHSPRLPTIASYRMPGVAASSQLINFDMAGIAVSAGSACSSGTIKTSHVLKAMGWNARAASEVIRISLGRQTTEAEVLRFIEVWQGIAARTKAA